jgi:hypothetical protein
MLTRRELLRAGVSSGVALALARGRGALAAPGPKVASVILLWMNGGPSHIDTWDPKSGRVAGPGKSIATSVPGLSVSEHLPALARVAHKLAVVRGGTSREGNHQRARYLMHTSYAPNPTVVHPSLAAWVVKRLGEPANGLPGSVSLGGPGGGPGFFGVESGPFVVQAPGQPPTDLAYGPGVDEARFGVRWALLDEMEARFAGQTGDLKVAGRRQLYAKADRLMRAPARRAFDVSEEPEAVRAAFGDSAFGRGCLTAARLVGAGVRFVEVALDGWDTHQDGFTKTARLMGVLDPAMSALLAELERRDLARSTMVVWMGDFGRTPAINANEGRDHHPGAWTAILAGGGIRGGVVHGETDAQGDKVVKDAVSVPDLLATIAAPLGLDPAEVAQSPAGRPIALTDGGRPVRALLA